MSVIAIALVIGIIIFGIRTYNTSKYKSKKYDSDMDLAASDLSQYDKDIEGVEVSRIVGDYLNGFRLTPNEKTHSGIVITFGRW